MRGIARLAKELGISTGTVSRALNDRRDVSPATRELVLATAKRLGYAPNQAARTLALGTTRSIGFMMDLDREAAASSEYFFMGVFDGVQTVFAEHNLDLLVLPRPTKLNAVSYLQRYVSRGVFDGMILAATQRTDPRIEFLESAGLPFATLGRSGSGKNYPWIDLDFEGVAEAAIDRLVAAGHRRIAVTVPADNINFGPIFAAAYERALARHGIGFDPQLVFARGRNEAVGYRLVDELALVPNPPTAVLLIFETVAIGMYRRMAELGQIPGRDLAIIGFRDEPTVRFLTPSLTCFATSLHEVGEDLARALLARLPGQGAEPHDEAVRKLAPLAIRPGESG
ncbi:MAG TPA: substrate-binding domain-containing protein [Devosia sp.]|uniref:substrate-binding domain-containing protein n=1 Tax=Devosia sp. TaxID=1871048 RepID=UPI002DDD43B8|nr:substrate-binding domain-containing protein [Devosia sp.]HEV2515725.1 substrate-binding domain-containing protein [Devosia sp.]